MILGSDYLKRETKVIYLQSDSSKKKRESKGPNKRYWKRIIRSYNQSRKNAKAHKRTL